MHTNYEGNDNFNEDMSGEDDNYPVEKNCNAEFGGLCQSSAKTDVATKFVKIFNRVIIDHSLKVGQLLVFSTASDSVFAFMGVRMQRPIVHTLVRATVGHDEQILFANGEQTQPVSLMTSHELFNQLDPSTGESIVVEVWSYTLEWNRDTGHLQIQMESKVKGFTLDPATKLTTRKPRIKLPFGLEMKKKERKKASKRTGSAKSKTMRSRRLLDATDTAHSQQQSSGRDHDGNDLKGDGDGDHASDSDSSTSSHPSTDSIIRGSEAPEEGIEDIDIAGTSDAAKQEDHEAKELIDEHEIIRNEFQSTPALPSSSSGTQKSETCQAAKPSKRLEPKVQEPKGKGTFFSKECGLAEVGVAASNRSRCYFCQNLIAKGSTRFSWHHSILKPPVWVHDGCLKHLVSRDGFKAQCKKRLQLLRRGVSSSDPPHLVSAIDSALTWA